MKCKELMSKQIFTCREDFAIQDCAQIMRDRNVGILPVVNEKNLVVGVVTDRDIALRVVAAGKRFSAPVRDVMTREVVRCHPEDSIQVAEEKMQEYRKSRIVVVNAKDHCLGIISLADIGRLEFHGHAGRVFQSVTQREMEKREETPYVHIAP